MATIDSHLVLEARALTCERSERLLFSNVSFEIKSGQMLLIRGPNGAGKSSLLRILAGLIQPQQGAVCWLNKSIDSCREFFNSELIYLGHRLNVNGQLTVRQNLQFMLELAAASHGGDDEALKQIGLLPFAEDLAQCLSEGQQRKIALARLIAQNAPVWILDEPTTSLDKKSCALVETIMQQHLKNNGMIILASHQPLSFNSPAIFQLELLGNGRHHFA